MKVGTDGAASRRSVSTGGGRGCDRWCTSHTTTRPQVALGWPATLELRRVLPPRRHQPGPGQPPMSGEDGPNAVRAMQSGAGASPQGSRCEPRDCLRVGSGRSRAKPRRSRKGRKVEPGALRGDGARRGLSVRLAARRHRTELQPPSRITSITRSIPANDVAECGDRSAVSVDGPGAPPSRAMPRAGTTGSHRLDWQRSDPQQVVDAFSDPVTRHIAELVDAAPPAAAAAATRDLRARSGGVSPSVPQVCAEEGQSGLVTLSPSDAPGLRKQSAEQLRCRG